MVANGNVCTLDRVTSLPASGVASEVAARKSLTTGQGSPSTRGFLSLPCNIGCRAWCRKYFWEGQSSQVDAGPGRQDDVPSCGERLVRRHRRLVAILLPALVFHFLWWSVAIKYQLWYLFPSRYVLSITMVVASTVAGMTSIGGGAIAFPVLTLLLDVAPSVARDFALLIQACGMSGATFTIFFMRVSVEWNSVVLCTIGGAVGLIVGLEWIEAYLTPSWKKMIFSSFWFSFAFALFLLNRYRKRKTFTTIPSFNWWKGLILVGTGVVGGVFTSFVGAGVDICSLSVLTLLFRVSEKTATPTSVVLMAFNSILGAFWRGGILRAVSQEAWEYLLVGSVVAVVAAPVGSVLAIHLHRQVLACIIYVIVTATLVTSFILVPQTPLLAGVSVAIIVLGFVIFFGLTQLGQHLMDSELADADDKKSDKSDGGDSDYSVATVTIKLEPDKWPNDKLIISHL